jgi:hypothetical protein
MDKPLLESLTQVITAFAWPLTLLLIVYLFRGPIAAKLERVKSVRGPGDTAVDFDLVQRIVEEGQAQRLDARQIAERIQRAVADKHELRILRALLGEDEGRFLMHYQDGDYRPALQQLLGKGLVRREGYKYYLTDSGLQALRPQMLAQLSARSSVTNQGNQSDS